VDAEFNTNKMFKVQPFEPGSFGSSTLSLAGISMGDCGAFIAVSGSTWTLTDNCTTTTSVKPLETLDFASYSIAGTGAFKGAIVANGGPTLKVFGGTVEGDNITGCMGGDDRLRGIMLEGASGAVTDMVVNNIHRGPNGCQEGNAIEVRNAPFDGSHPNTLKVKIANNTISGYQKSGIVANGDVNVSIHDNVVNESAAQDVLAANGIQVGFGALGSVKGNSVGGNTWETGSAVATGMLIYLSTASVVDNTVSGDSDVGIYHFGLSGAVAFNRVLDDADPQDPFWGNGVSGVPDYGIGHWGETGGNAHHNYVCGFEVAYEGTIGPKNTDGGDPCPS